MQFAEFRAFRNAIADVQPEVRENGLTPAIVAALTPDEQIRTAAKQLDADLADELLQRVRAATPAFFEALIIRLLLAMGYGGSVSDLSGALVGGSGDNGVDGVIDQDPLGLAVSTFRRNDTLTATPSDQAPSEISSAHSTASRLQRACS